MDKFLNITFTRNTYVRVFPVPKYRYYDYKFYIITNMMHWLRLSRSALIFECLLFGLKNRGLSILLPDVSPASVAGIFRGLVSWVVARSVTVKVRACLSGSVETLLKFGAAKFMHSFDPTEISNCSKFH